MPYATSDGLGPEAGYTDSDVIATGDYEITTGEGTTTVDVPEETIYEGAVVEIE